MRIGIDARLLSIPLVGVGRYTYQMVLALADAGAELVLYSPAPLTNQCPVPDGVVVRTGHFRSRVGRMLWSQSQLPYWARNDGIELFWGPAHRLPKFLPPAIPTVVTIHDLVWKFAAETMRPVSYFFERRLMPQSVGKADMVIADSQSTARDLVAEFPEVAGRVRVVHLGPSPMPMPEGFESLRKLGIASRYFLFVGTLEPRKNLERLLRAYASLPDVVRSRMGLVIAGGKGWGGLEVPALVERLGLGAQVVLLGYVTDQQLSTLYRHASFLAMPALYEGFGLPLVEAMSHGTPVLTSASSSMPEIAGDAGVLIDPLDEESIAAGLQRLIADDAVRGALALKATKQALKFSWSQAAQDALGVFREAMAARKSGVLR